MNGHIFFFCMHKERKSCEILQVENTKSILMIREDKEPFFILLDHLIIIFIIFSEVSWLEFAVLDFHKQFVILFIGVVLGDRVHFPDL